MINKKLTNNKIEEIDRNFRQILPPNSNGTKKRDMIFSSGFNNPRGQRIETLQNESMKNVIQSIANTLIRNSEPQAGYGNHNLKYTIIFRDVGDISNYSQDWHINANADNKGVFFHQILYYLDDLPTNIPIRRSGSTVLNKILTARNKLSLKKRELNGNTIKPANIGGYLVTSNGNHLKTIRPEKGRVVSFQPNKTWHKVVPISINRPNKRPIGRRMIIIALKRPFKIGENKAVENSQVYPTNLGQRYLNQLIAGTRKIINKNKQNNYQPPKKRLAVTSNANNAKRQPPKKAITNINALISAINKLNIKNKANIIALTSAINKLNITNINAMNVNNKLNITKSNAMNVNNNANNNAKNNAMNVNNNAMNVNKAKR